MNDLKTRIRNINHYHIIAVSNCLMLRENNEQHKTQQKLETGIIADKNA